MDFKVRADDFDDVDELEFDVDDLEIDDRDDEVELEGEFFEMQRQQQQEQAGILDGAEMALEGASAKAGSTSATGVTYDFEFGSGAFSATEFASADVNISISDVIRVDYKIDEERFHRIPLHSMDLFVLKGRLRDGASERGGRWGGGERERGAEEDEEEDLFDFSEVYFTEPDGNIYSIPKILSQLPSQPLRFSCSRWICRSSKYNPRANEPHQSIAMEVEEVTKVFFFRHLNDLPSTSPLFALDLEEIYVVDGRERSIRRAVVQLEVEGGRERDRRLETLVVRDDGNTFKIIPNQKRKTPEEVLHEHHWRKSKESLETYLRGFRDYEMSNWF